LIGRIAAGPVGLRPPDSRDEPFLRELDGAVVAEQLGLGALGGAAGAAGAGLLEFQYAARRRDRATRFPGADASLVLLDGDPVGAVTVDGSPDRLLVVDIAVVAGARRKGVAATVLRAVCADADARGLTVRASARVDNHASRRLFAAVGFREIADDGQDVSLERACTTSPKSS
jgi:ribosomal protein S18 acetylase RimI-like enzyme